MNPNYLSRDELIYELRARGIHSEEEVHLLRKLFRTVVARDLPQDSRLLGEFSVDELYACVLRKIHELQDLVESSETSTPSLVTRVRSKLLHLRGRLWHLEDREEAGLNFGSTSLRTLFEQLDAMEKTIVMADASERPGRGIVGGSSRETVSKADELDVENSGKVVQETTRGATPSVVRASQFLSITYQKLPHPITHLLNELPQVDGCNVNVLCEFLLKVSHLRQVSQVAEPTIYELLYPLCKGEVLVLLRQAIAKGEDFDSFHSRVLKHCVPERQLSQLRIDRYERVQEEGESLAQYSQAIRDAALGLQIKESETQVVRRILEGLTPSQRARFVFQSPPRDWQELEQLFVVDRNLAYTEQTRKGSTQVVRANAVDTGSTGPAFRAGRAVSKRGASGNVVICFRCGKPGHIQRDCVIHSERRRRQGPRPGTRS